MKGFDIAIFTILLVFSFNIVSASGILGDYHSSYTDIAESINSTIVSTSPKQSEEISYTQLAISAFGLLVQSLVIVIAVVAYSTILLPYFLGSLGLPASFNAAITICVWIAYLITYAQYKARSNLEY
jgi:hypothetical protein